MSDTFLTSLMLGGVVLALGGVYGLKTGGFRPGQRKRPVLMLVATLVCFANIAIWLWPMP